MNDKHAAVHAGFAHDDFDSRLYRAVARSRRDAILQYGFTGYSYWGIEAIAAYYAKVIQEEGQEAVVISLSASAFDPAFLEPDRPSIEEPITTVLCLNEPEIWDVWSNSKQDWQACFAIVGSVKYGAALPFRPFGRIEH